jgi:hypothetical protein
LTGATFSQSFLPLKRSETSSGQNPALPVDPTRIGNAVARRAIAQSATDATAHRNKARVKPTNKTTMIFLAMPAFLLRFIAGCPEPFLIAHCPSDMARLTCNNYLLAAAGPTIRRSENWSALLFSFIGNALHCYFRNNKNLTLLAAAEFVA